MTTTNQPTGQPPDPPAPFPSLDQLSAGIPPIAWLWPGWIPRGMITLLCAQSGAGKSYLALDLARRLIAGLPWPDGTPQGPAGTPQGPAEARNVIYVDAEAATQLLNARSLAWGMDRTRLFPMLAVPGGGRDAGSEAGLLDLNAPACRQRLSAMVAALHPALIIVDSLGSATRGAENQVSVVEGLFRYLNDLAARYQTALLLIHHLNKHAALGGGPRAATSLEVGAVRGSGHIVSLARSVLGLAPVQVGLDLDPDAPRRLQVLKTNLGLVPEPLGVTFTSPSQPPAGADTSGPDRSGPDAAVGALPASRGVELTYGPAPGAIQPPRTQAEACARWLLDILKAYGRPVSPSEIEWYAHEAGYSRATLFRARDLLGARIADTRAHRLPGNRWALPEWPPPPPPPPPKPRPSRTRK